MLASIAAYVVAGLLGWVAAGLVLALLWGRVKRPRHVDPDPSYVTDYIAEMIEKERRGRAAANRSRARRAAAYRSDDDRRAA